MDERRRALAVAAATVGLFLLVQLGALALAEPFDAAGYRAVEDPSDPTNSLVYVVVILVATGVILAALRFGARRIIRVVIVLTAGLLSWYVFSVVFALGLSAYLSAGAVALLAAAASGAIVVGLLVHPEWYVLDAAGVVMGAGAAGLFGISFGILPALILLSVLAVYDAISVYGTEHMLTLAEGVMDLKVPVLLVIPTTLSYSFLAAAPADEMRKRDDGGHGTSDEGEHETSASPGTSDGSPDAANPAAAAADAAGSADEPDGSPAAANADAKGSAGGLEGGPLARDALFIGLGDAVIPTVLVASAGTFVDAPSLVPGLALNIPAGGAMAGSLAGLLVLLWMVFRGRPHAGLPLLNGGAILGYLLGALASGIPLEAALGL